ncbi:MAG: DUF4402 domain-containing protein [Bacteroidetes bacterium]|nr:DUF4402 domain-containing protein [Bacteroidota bacterium]MBS1629051.1 DUF4402 domain-containing protein [Bacteroidota bacterium]
MIFCLKTLLRQSGKPLSLMVAFVFVVLGSAKAQVQPPRPLSVYVNPAQPLSFGAFYQGPLGGSISVAPTGSRSSTGDVVQAGFGYSFSPAMFEVEGLPGTIVSILNGPDVTLTGSNGGSMLLHIGASSPSSPFILTTTPPSRTVVNIGGTLTVGSPASNPAGSYNGTFTITFIEQ